MSNELGLIREFKAGQFRVVVDALVDESPDFSFDESGQTERDVASGKLVVYIARVRVIHRDLGELSADYLCNCMGRSILSFMDHREAGAMQRQARRQPGQETMVYGSQFRDKVGEVIAAARERLIELNSVWVYVRQARGKSVMSKAAVTRWGTAHFQSGSAAVRYYARQGISAHGVDEKLKAGEIFYGRPTVKDGQTLTLDPVEGRYFIEESQS